MILESRKEENQPSTLSSLFSGYAQGEHQLTLTRVRDLKTPQERTVPFQNMEQDK
jgi:hypothetical protein